MSKSVAAVILNYNSYPDTIKLVKALQRQSIAPDLSIVVVDNASCNESYRYLKPLETEYDRVVVLETGENIGYARGNNYGLKYLEQHVKPDYVAILNNDIALDDDCFERLIERYESLESPAIVAPKQITPDGNIYVGGMISRFSDDFKNLFFIYRYLNKVSKSSCGTLPDRGVLPVELVLGSFIFASMERFKEIGYFYPRTFLFVEERFVAHQAKKLGYQNYVLMDMSYLHAHSKTIDTAFTQLQKYRMQYAGWLEFTRVCRSYGRLKAALLRPFIIYSLLEVAVVYRVLNLIKMNSR